jgi:Sec-independent protein translocase protein TatA
MDIFGIGPTEIFFIVLLALILLGPKEMEKTGRTIGRFLRDMTKSEGWRAFRDTSREIRNLPNRLMREANIEDIKKDVGNIGKEIEESATVKGLGTWTNPSANKPKPSQPGPKPVEASQKPVPPAAAPTPPIEPTQEPNKESDKEANQNA